MRLLFIHGRAQEGRSEAELRSEWTGSLGVGLARAGLEMPDNVQIDVPFYGDKLDEWRDRSRANPEAPLTARGATGDDGFESFYAAVADEALQANGIQEDALLAVARDMGLATNDEEALGQRGPMNWRSVRVMAKALDRLPGVSETFFRKALYDVYIYLEYAQVSDAIHGIVRETMSDEPTVIVGHSLGTVVAYRMLLHEAPIPALRRLVTLGSPLGIAGISRQIKEGPDVPPAPLTWYNALDTRDIVALRPLNARHFFTNPEIINNNRIDNDTRNRHGITGYLNNPEVAKAIYVALTS